MLGKSQEGDVAEIKIKRFQLQTIIKKYTLENATSGDSGYADVSANPNPEINH